MRFGRPSAGRILSLLLGSVGEGNRSSLRAIMGFWNGMISEKPCRRTLLTIALLYLMAVSVEVDVHCMSPAPRLFLFCCTLHKRDDLELLGRSSSVFATLHWIRTSFSPSLFKLSDRHPWSLSLRNGPDARRRNGSESLDTGRHRFLGVRPEKLESQLRNFRRESTRLPFFRFACFCTMYSVRFDIDMRKIATD